MKFPKLTKSRVVFSIALVGVLTLVGVYVITPQPELVVVRPAPPKAKRVKPVEPPPPPLPIAPPPETNAPLAVVFPDLRLQGLIYNGDNSTAVINGWTLRVGRHIGEVKLVAIAPKTVTVELSGEQRVLHLEAW